MLRQPNGTRLPVYYHKGQDKRQLVQDVLLPHWETYCNSHWMEQGVKTYLDGLAYLLLRDHGEDTMTTYKEMARRRSEIPVSSCPDCVGAALYGKTYPKAPDIGPDTFAAMLEKLDDRAKKHGYKPPPKPRCPPPTRGVRITQIRADHPGCTFFIHRVDTDNCFEADGARYRIDASVAAYQPKQTAEGAMYDMDQIVAVHRTDGGVLYFDQAYRPLEDGAVTPA